MEPWFPAAAVLFLSWIPLTFVCLTRPPSDRLVALEMAGSIQTLLFLLLAEAFHRPSFFDLALTAALLSFGGGMVFARFLERWL